MAALAHPRAGAVSLLGTMLAAVDYFKRAVPVQLGTTLDGLSLAAGWGRLFGRRQLPVRHGCALMARRAPRFLIILTGRNVPNIRQPRKPGPSIVTEKTIADFTRAVLQTAILEREPTAQPVDLSRRRDDGRPSPSPSSL